MSADLDARFDYHPPTAPGRAQEHESARAAFKALAQAMDAALPAGREKSLCMTQLEQGLFWANAAIARQDSPRT